MKSGTTTLHELLAQHPEISMSEPNEPCYFIGYDHLNILWPEMWRMEFWKNESSYLTVSKFKPHAISFGESNTDYSRRLKIDGGERKNAAFYLLTQLVYLMRNAIAHFRLQERAQTLALETQLGRSFDKWKRLWGTT
jgi:hypothetical protein